jgi:two-component system, chemotaxis family, protein-glutamate methylesterase/glutaminase
MPAPSRSSAPGGLRVLVVDDLRFMCIALRQIIEADGDMQVVGEARNGEEALALAHELKPDVVTMDIEMPVMDGLEATRRILGEIRPAPIVIMVSNHTQSGAAATVEALRLGAADFVSKASTLGVNDLGHIDSELRRKIRACAEFRRAGSPARRNETAAPVSSVSLWDAHSPSGAPDLVAVAVSTGGPLTLTALLRAIGPISVPIVIAQHMPEFFTACLARSLSEDTGLAVREGGHRQPVPAGEVTILPGGKDALVAPRPGGGFELRLSDADAAGSIHPSADVLFESAAMAARRPVAVILTGMGHDGTRGASRFAHRGRPVLVQRPDTCVIDGMPKAAIEAGVASEALTLDEIAQRLRRWTAAAVLTPEVETASPS